MRSCEQGTSGQVSEDDAASVRAGTRAHGNTGRRAYGYNMSAQTG